MHLRGKSFEYTVIYPDGRSEVLLRVPNYDFFWQLDYQLSKPLTIPPGTQIVCTAWFDNSPNNPKNPDPTATVRFSKQSWEEMMIGFYDVVIPADMSVQEFFTPKKTGGATSGNPVMKIDFARFAVIFALGFGRREPSRWRTIRLPRSSFGIGKFRASYMTGAHRAITKAAKRFL